MVEHCHVARPQFPTPDDTDPTLLWVLSHPITHSCRRSSWDQRASKPKPARPPCKESLPSAQPLFPRTKAPRLSALDELCIAAQL